MSRFARLADVKTREIQLETRAQSLHCAAQLLAEVQGEHLPDWEDLPPHTQYEFMREASHALRRQRKEFCA